MMIIKKREKKKKNCFNYSNFVVNFSSRIFLILFILIISLFFLNLSKSYDNEVWISCCQRECDYGINNNIEVDSTRYYCCNHGWQSGECGSTLSECDGINFISRCPTASTTFYLSCENDRVCVYKIGNVFVCDNTNKRSDVISEVYYCIDKKRPEIIGINHRPEIISSNIDYTYDPFPNYYVDSGGINQLLTPEKIVIDKESIIIETILRDEFNGREISGVRTSRIYFNISSESYKSLDFPLSSCPEGANYVSPAIHRENFRNLNIGWGRVFSNVVDQSGNENSNSNYLVYVFLGARGDQQGQRSSDKIIFLKTFWESREEVKISTNNIAGKSDKKINCFDYVGKCTQIRDIIGKTDEFSDCLWIGPSNNPRNVRIYNFKEIIDLTRNEKIIPRYYKDFNNKVAIGWDDISPTEITKIAFCSKNDSGILVDLPFLVSKDIKDGFQILPSTEKRFSVIWQVEYAREQREVVFECYLNPNYYDPTTQSYRVCTLEEILNNTCLLNGNENISQKCFCGNSFPCIQDTSRKTINTCSIENPKYFPGKNRIICRVFDPRTKGIDVEIWFNHEFYYINRKIIDKETGVEINKKYKIFELFIYVFNDFFNNFKFLILKNIV